jgi:hypothetical protein
VTDSDELHDLIADRLGTGVISSDALHGALGAADHRATRSEVDRALNNPLFVRLSNGYAYLPALADGIRWTAWVDANEAAEGFVRLTPWLAPIAWWLIEDPPRLASSDPAHDGHELTISGRWLDDSQIDVMTGPDGWLDELAGSWAEVTVSGDTMRWSPCPVPPAVASAQVASVAAGYQRAADTTDTTLPPLQIGGDRRPVQLRFAGLSGPLEEALASDRALFVEHPVPPLPDLYEKAGLEIRRSVVAEPDFDWDALSTWQARNRLGLSFDLDDAEADAVIQLGALVLTSVGKGGEQAVVDALGSTDDDRAAAATHLADCLSSSEVSRAFASEVEQLGLTEQVQPVAGVLERLCTGEAPVGLVWTQALGLEAADRAQEAEAALASALDPSRPASGAGADRSSFSDHRFALLDLAGYAADRSDIDRAHELLLRAVDDYRCGHDFDDPWDIYQHGGAHHGGDRLPVHYEMLLEEVRGFRRLHPKAAVGRNEPCPCGSGRKYKACHLGREGRVPFVHRAAWLHDKATRWALRHLRPELDDLAEGIVGWRSSFRDHDDWMSSPVVVDLALHEGGGFSRFVDSRRPLLPDDEAALLDRWATTERGVFQVELVQDRRIRLRDHGRDEVRVVSNVHPSPQTVAGLSVLARPLPVGDTYRSFSGLIPLPAELVEPMSEAVAAGDPDDIATIIGQVAAAARH